MKCMDCGNELKQLEGKHKIAVQLDGKEQQGMSSMGMKMEQFLEPKKKKKLSWKKIIKFYLLICLFYIPIRLLTAFSDGFLSQWATKIYFIMASIFMAVIVLKIYKKKREVKKRDDKKISL